MVQIDRRCKMNNIEFLAKFEKLQTQYKIDFAKQTSHYSPEQAWELGYQMLEIIWQNFDSFPDYFDFELSQLKALHNNQLNTAQQEAIFQGIDYARTEYYESLNETGDLALILAKNANLSHDQLQQIYHHYLQVGINNFNDDELKKWANMELLSV